MVLRGLEKLPGDVDLASEVSGSLLLPKLSLYNISKVWRTKTKDGGGKLYDCRQRK